MSKSKFIKPREFVRRYAEPYLMRPVGGKNGPPPELEEIAELLKENRTDEVIKKFDDKAPSLPENRRLCLAVSTAYIQSGENLQRARVLLDAARKYYSEKGDMQRYALACAHMARVAYRVGDGFKAAMNWYKKAWRADSFCLGAWTNAFCHTSLEQLEDELTVLTRKFVKTVPNFTKNPIYRKFFREDAQLGWARCQKVFRELVIGKLTGDFNNE